jgi:uncharacterized ion transporter superfamily protein YfcC
MVGHATHENSVAREPRPSRGFRVPHTLVLLFGIMVLAWIATWLLPQGAFERVADDAGRMVVVPGSYTPVEERVAIPPWALLTAVPRALGAAQMIIFFLFIVGGAIAVLRATGMIDAVLGVILRKIGHSPLTLISLGVLIFATGSSLLGASLEYIPFAAVLVALCLAMRLDAITAIGIMVAGYGIGYGVAIMNPYTIMVAQPIAGVELLSGLWYRLVLFPAFVLIGIHHVWAYSRRVQRDPARSLMFGVAEAHAPAEAEYPQLTGRRLIVAFLTLGALVIMVVGISGYGWYLIEVGAVWLGLAIVAGLVGGLKLDDTANRFGQGAAELAVAALLVGFARAISLLLEEGQVLDTIVHGLSIPLQQVGPAAASVGMLVLQTLLNFFIPSGSGQAFATMPIMAPLSDVVGVSRQVAVLAFQFGDGFSNMVLPTNIVLMAILGVAGIPYDRWFRFAAPLLLKLMAAAAAALVIAVLIGYQ